MPSELEELVDFISHGNTQVRKLAVENLVPYSSTHPAVFKAHELQPITDLKLLVRDYKDIAKDAITMLINLSTDKEVLHFLAEDEAFINSLLTRITNPKEPNANLLCMLLANLAKHEKTLLSLLTLTRPSPAELSSTIAIDQLLDLFVKGADGTYNPDADFDYLCYLFADLAKHKDGRTYFLTTQPYDSVIPLTKLVVFTEHKSDIRRKGVASTIKNVAFNIDAHPSFLSPAAEDINVLPYLLLPMTGSEEYDEDDMLSMLDDLQLLPPDKEREKDAEILKTHIETLMLLTTTRGGRDYLREVRVYPTVRETHLQVEDEEVREACERLVQVLMRDEENDEVVSEGMKALVSRRPKRAAGAKGAGEAHVPKPFGRQGWATQEAASDEEEEDDDDKIVEV